MFTALSLSALMTWLVDSVGRAMIKPTIIYGLFLVFACSLLSQSFYNCTKRPGRRKKRLGWQSSFKTGHLCCYNVGSRDIVIYYRILPHIMDNVECPIRKSE